jgi:uncharacterized protein involved in outer membrane biogenesis
LFGKLKKYLLYFLALYAILGFFVLPLVLKPQLIDAVQTQTNAKLSCERIYFNPFIWKLSLNGVVVESLQNKKLVSFDKLAVDFEFYSLFTGAIHLKTLELINPHLYVAYQKDKTINLLSIVKEQNEQTPHQEDDNTTSTLPRIIVDKIALVDGTLHYDDYTRKEEFSFSLKRIGFSLKGIDTQNISKENAILRFHTALGDGGFFDFKSELLSLEPFVAKGRVDFEASKLYTEWRYLKENLNLEVADGKISFGANYYLNLEDLKSTKISELNLAFDKLRVKPKNKYKDVLNLEHACVKNATILPMLQDINIEELCLMDLKVKVKRNKKGQIDWLEYIKTNFPQTPTQEEQNPSTPWNVLVQNIKLEKIGVSFEDRGVAPKVNTKLNELNIYASNATLLGKEPMSYSINLRLNDKFQCHGSGKLVHNVLDLRTQLECKDFDLVHYKPYIDTLAKKELKTYNLDLQKASVDLTLHARVKSVDDAIVIFTNNTSVSLKNLKLAKRTTKEKIVAFREFKVSGIALDTEKKELVVANTSLDGFALNAKRYKDKTLNLLSLIEVKPLKKKTKSTKKTKEKPYSVNLQKVLIDRAKVEFKDEALSPSVKSTIDKITLKASDIDLKAKTWLKYKLAMRINKKGKLYSSGKIRHTPLAQKGSFELKSISLKELTPYIQEYAYVNVDDGFISMKTKTHFRKSHTRPDLVVDGSFHLSKLYAVDSRDQGALLAFSKVDLKTFTLELAPNRFYTDEVDVGNFYIDVLIDKKKKMNFAKLVKNAEQNASKEEVVSKDTNTTAQPAFPVKIVKVSITEGNVKFADLSIPIDFRTNIHNLNGTVFPVSNIAGETTIVDLSGEVDKYGSTKLSGQVNASDPKEFTNLSFNFKNLEMNSFSGYSASFAGHEIDGGKLYLDLGYKINDSQLHGENSIIIKQMKLGREIEDENVTKLPLGFVIALLEDSDGVIDIDMPVEGNLDEPDFKYGALIWRTIGGLITKAITSPFKFLGSMMGFDGDTLEYAEFEAGSDVILPTEREKLDNIAKMMIKRPKIDLAFTPAYDAEVDKQAMQLDKLIDIVVERSGIENKKDHKSAMTIDMLEDIYEDLRDDDALDKLQQKLQKEYPKEDEKYDRAYLLALSQLDASLQVVTQEELEQLAQRRVDTLVHYLTTLKEIDAKRLLRLELEKISNSEDKLVKMPLQIKVK